MRVGAARGDLGRLKEACVWVATLIAAAGLMAGCGGSAAAGAMVPGDGGTQRAGEPGVGANGQGDAGNADATMGAAGDASLGDDAFPAGGGGAPVGDEEDCCTACNQNYSAYLDLSCAPAAVTSAVLTGACAPDPTDDASASIGPGFSCDPPVATTTPFADCSDVAFGATTSGDCHVAFTFANGSTYSGDVQFTAIPPICCGCPALTFAPSPGVLVVKTPGAPCTASDAGDQ
jgi:hypothetical protein